MKKHNFFSKSVMCLLAITMSVALFAGCQSKDASSNTKQTNTQTSQSNNKKLSADEMKKRTQDSIKPLITAGTITQAQSDKIVETLTANRTNNSGQKKSQNGQQGNQNSNQSKTKTSPLSKLVSDGVITQAQADAVMQKMKGNFKNKNNGQTSN